MSRRRRPPYAKRVSLLACERSLEEAFGERVGRAGMCEDDRTLPSMIAFSVMGVYRFRGRSLIAIPGVFQSAGAVQVDSVRTEAPLEAFERLSSVYSFALILSPRRFPMCFSMSDEVTFY